jgi:hypothetical protein
MYLIFSKDEFNNWVELNIQSTTGGYPEYPLDIIRGPL